MGLFNRDKDKRNDIDVESDESDFVKKLQQINEEKAKEPKLSEQYDPLDGYEIQPEGADVADDLVDEAVVLPETKGVNLDGTGHI